MHPRIRNGVRAYRGAAMVETIVAGAMIVTVGLVIVQFALLMSARNVLNYAAFEAARAGAFAHANIDSIRTRFATALTPLYGGAANPAQWALAVAKAQADVALNARVDLLNPVRESFDDFNDSALQKTIGNGARTIANSALQLRDVTSVGSASKQNLVDANVLRLRITYGYAPRVPIARQLMLGAWKLAGAVGGASDGYDRQLVAQGRLPVVVHTTMRMQSEPIETAAVKRASDDATGHAGSGSSGGSGNPPGGSGPAPVDDSGGSPDADQSGNGDPPAGGGTDGGGHGSPGGGGGGGGGERGTCS